MTGLLPPPDDTREADHESPAPRFIVGVGASAGGLEALERLFAHMPADTGLAFVVVQHLSPDFKSLTNQLLARRTSIPIRQVEDGMVVCPDAIYLLPPRKDMILSGGKLLLSDKDPAQSLTLPIDHFFRSLAHDAGPRAVGVVLSGTGSDGSRGIRDIREAGGLVIAQVPDTAKFDGMPKSAVAAGVDLTLPPEEVPTALLRHIRHPLGQGVAAPDPALSERGLASIFRLLRDHYGIDFAAYKPDTVGRRIERRLGLVRADGVDEYAARLAGDPAELNLLYKDLLIGVTRFFRDPEAFEILGRDIIPPLLQRRRPDEEFRVWVAGCATGEERYSLAILIQECLDALPRPVPVKVFATDVHRGSLDFASAGVYEAASLAGVSPARLARFFVPRGDRFQVAPAVRKLVVFAQHNVLKDAPFTRLDLITCRNLLIYFLPQAQKKVLSLFHFGLRTGGALFLGPSEGPGDLAEEFELVAHRWKLYRKRRDVRLPTDIRLTVGGDRPIGRQPAAPALDPVLVPFLDLLLEECMPTALLVNDRREVVRTFSGGSRFLNLHDGWVSLDVLEAVRPELRPVLAGALPRVFKELRPVAFKGRAVRFPEGERVIDVTVKPLHAARSAVTYALVCLAESGGPAVSSSVAEINLQEASREHVRDLESELTTTKESLQAMIEELETSNEELQATNEELVASNEELQSTNEELHSVNEELYTVNGEYQKKIEQLTELTADMENLLASTDVHTVFLDAELCIRKFTPKVAETFNLLPHDVGRRIDHFTHTIDHPDLLADLQAVLREGQPLERQVRSQRGQWFLMRVLPYHGAAGAEGVVLTLIDLTRVKAAEAETRQKDQQLAGILRNSPSWVFVKDLDGRYLLAADAFQQAVGCDPIGKTAAELFGPEVSGPLVAQDDRVLAEGAAVEAEVVIPHPDGPHVYLSVLFPIRDDAGRISCLGGIRTDITPLKRAELHAREAVAQRDQFLAMLSHELRNPLAAIRNAARLVHRSGPTSEQAEAWFQVIERRAEHMTRLLGDLLDVARITRNKFEVRREPLDLTETLSEVVEEVRGLYEQHGVRLTVEPPATPVRVLGDRARLQQAQVNLLTNAAKYTPAGGEVGYTLTLEDSEAVVRVRDTGAGMSPEVLARAFDLFVQADETLDRSAGGIGVGLTLVRAIVELHGGRVTAYSAGPGRGSEFVLRLPLTDAPVPATTAAAATAAAAGPPVAGRSLLVVEDDPDIRASLVELLRLDGYVVRAAADGPSAVAEAERSRPDFALVDIGIPGMTGYEVAARLRQRYPKDRLTLIALTGYGRKEDQQAAFAAGFDAHLTKPLHPDELARLLGRLDPAPG